MIAIDRDRRGRRGVAGFGLIEMAISGAPARRRRWRSIVQIVGWLARRASRRAERRQRAPPGGREPDGAARLPGPGTS